jgi:hypothetical protein
MQEISDEIQGLAASSPVTMAAHVRFRSSPQLGARIRDLVRRTLGQLRQTKNIWAFAFHSFRGHIRTQSSKGPAIVDYGPALLRRSDGYWRPNVHTHARSLYTRKLQAILPWADCVDLEIFLMGFDAGAQWSRDSSQSNIGSDAVADMSVSWITPMERGSILDAITEATVSALSYLHEAEAANDGTETHARR